MNNKTYILQQDLACPHPTLNYILPKGEEFVQYTDAVYKHSAGWVFSVKFVENTPHWFKLKEEKSTTMNNSTQDTDNKRFANDAKALVDMLFETRVFRADLTRDNLDTIESLILFNMQSAFDTHLRCEKLAEKIANNKNTNQ